LRRSSGLTFLRANAGQALPAADAHLDDRVKTVHLGLEGAQPPREMLRRPWHRNTCSPRFYYDKCESLKSSREQKVAINVHLYAKLALP
jgi:hypothetical protein